MQSVVTARPLFVTVGDNPARAFGMGAGERAEALAIKARLEPAIETGAGRSTVYADLNWVWDPQWLVELAEAPGRVLSKGGHPVLAHVPVDGDPAQVLAAMLSGGRYEGGALELLDADTADFSYRKLRKRDRPFVMRLDPANAVAAERADALAIKAQLEPATEPAGGRSTVYAELGWVWDPQWLVELAETPGPRGMSIAARARSRSPAPRRRSGKSTPCPIR